MFPDDTSSTTVSALTAPAPYTHTDVHYGHPRAGTEKVRARQRAKFLYRIFHNCQKGNDLRDQIKMINRIRG